MFVSSTPGHYDDKGKVIEEPKKLQCETNAEV